MLAHDPNGEMVPDHGPLMSTRSASPNGCFTATGMCTCFPDSDNDSHTPLLVHLTLAWMSNKEKRELRNLETLKASHDSHRERQRAKKRGDPAPSSTETPGTSSTRPAEPENPPFGKGKRPAEPADPPSGKGKGKRPAEPADPPKGKGKGQSQKGKKGDLEKGKSKKGSSKGSTDKGKSKDKRYSKGKGQKCGGLSEGMLLFKKESALRLVSQFVFHDAHGMHQFLMVSRLTCCI